MNNIIGGTSLLAMAGIVFILATISLQIGSMKPNSWWASAFLMVQFIVAILIAALAALIGTTFLTGLV